MPTNNSINTYYVIGSGREVTQPLQPAFLGYLNGNQANKTGNAAVYQLGSNALTEIYDQNSDFNVNGTFTAPATGKVDFTAMGYLYGLATLTGFQIDIVTTLRTYSSFIGRAASSSNQALSANCLADMDVGDTAIVNFIGTGEAGNTADVYGPATNPATYFCGALIC